MVDPNRPLADVVRLLQCSRLPSVVTLKMQRRYPRFSVTRTLAFSNADIQALAKLFPNLRSLEFDCGNDMLIAHPSLLRALNEIFQPDSEWLSQAAPFLTNVRTLELSAEAGINLSALLATLPALTGLRVSFDASDNWVFEDALRDITVSLRSACKLKALEFCSWKKPLALVLGSMLSVLLAPLSVSPSLSCDPIVLFGRTCAVCEQPVHCRRRRHCFTL